MFSPLLLITWSKSVVELSNTKATSEMFKYVPLYCTYKPLHVVWQLMSIIQILIIFIGKEGVWLPLIVYLNMLVSDNLCKISTVQFSWTTAGREWRLHKLYLSQVCMYVAMSGHQF